MKLFRKIREQVLFKSKTKKYFLYAGGEILLVVIGILIALQINNWNQNENNRETEKRFYQNVKSELKDDYNSLIGNIAYSQRYKRQYQYAVEIIETKDFSKIDTLGIIAVNLMKNSDFDRQNTIYESMVNSGQIKFVNNQEIIQRLHNLEETYIYINRLENIQMDAVVNFVVPEVVRYVNIKKARIENVDQLYGYQFQNNFMVMISVSDEKEEVYEKAIKEIDLILELIDKEILI